MTEGSPRLRIGVLGIVAFALFAVLFGRLWYLQVMVAPRFAQAARVSQVRVIQIAPIRGRILDRNGVVLAENKLTTVVTVERADIASTKARTALFAKMAPILGETPVQLEARYRGNQYSPLLPLPLTTIKDEGTAVFLKERLEEFPGVAVTDQPERFYTYGPLAAHVIGYIGKLSKEVATGYAHDCDADLTAPTCYQLSDTVGISGVEQVFERELRGRPGYRKLEVDAKGRVIQVLKDVVPVPGNDVVLTIDAQIQQLAEQALAVKLQEVATRGPIDRASKLPTGARYTAPTGVVVVEDPSNGQILAMASYPTFDPREFAQGISQERYNQLYSKEQNFPLLNRVVQGEYAPASTFKLVTATATISYGLKSPADTYTDTGKFDLHDLEPKCSGLCIFHNAGNQVNGKIDMRQALSVSSDDYFYDIGARFWLYRNYDPNRIVRYDYALQDEARRYGFGSATGVQLPDEHAGRVPDDTVKQQLHQEHPGAFPDGVWTTGDNINVAIGQGLVSVTPLQLVNAYAAFANGGTLWYPNIAQAIDANGTAGTDQPKVLRAVQPRANATISLPPIVRDPILLGLEGAVGAADVGNGRSGTAFQAWQGFPLDHFMVAGKTGTAQDNTQLPENDNSVFVAFGPVQNPKYAVLCIMEKSGFGADAAAPVVRRVFEGLPQVGVYALDPLQPADPVGAQPSDVTRLSHTETLLKPPPLSND